MPSKTATIVLGLLTAVFGTLAGIQMAQQDLGSVFGAPPRQAGEVLYEFDVEEVHTVRIRNSSGDEALFRKQGGAWIMHEPVHDRADFRDLQRLVYFSRHLRVENVIRRGDITLEESGMRPTAVHRGRFQVVLTDQRGKEVASYRLGRRTAWHRLDEESGEKTQTFFVRPDEDAQKEYIYVCSAPPSIRPGARQILDRGFEGLRDHRPFLFDPATLAEITIRRAGVEIVLTRESKDQPWRFAKPLEARTNPETMAGLLNGLYKLQAVKLHAPGAVTIPPRPPSEYYMQFELRRFDTEGNRQDRTSTLTVERPSAATAETIFATMKGTRPEVVFELPFKPAKDRFALQQLPIEVDLLRSRTLVSLDIRALRKITVHESGQPDPILLFLSQATETDQGLRWMLNLHGNVSPANEYALAGLLHALTSMEVLGYPSDAARDLRAYGLSPPTKRLILEGPSGSGEAVDLLFGRGGDGRFYAMRRETTTVAEIKPAAFTSIPARPHEWRDTLLMPFSIVDLAVLRIERPIVPPLRDSTLTLNYTFLDESWSARQFGVDATPRLDPQRANRFIKFMEGLRVDKWLDDTVPAAQLALQEPTFRFTAVFRKLNEAGDRVGLREVSFDLAPASRSSLNQYYYGRLSGDPHYFLITRDTYRELTRPLLDGP